jgi:hypothetical protein
MSDAAWEKFKQQWADGKPVNTQLLDRPEFNKIEGHEVTNDDARQIIEILLTADNDCPYCSRTLCNKFLGRYPEYKNQVEAMFRAKYDTILGETHGNSTKVGSRKEPDRDQDQSNV